MQIILTDAETRAARKVELEAKAQERAATATELLQRRRLLLAERRKLSDKLPHLEAGLSFARSRKDATTVVESQAEIAAIETQIAELNNAIEAIEERLVALLPNTQFGKRIVYAGASPFVPGGA
jgi:predicted nuclease with TOPRIM domain